MNELEEINKENKTGFTIFPASPKAQAKLTGKFAHGYKKFSEGLYPWNLLIRPGLCFVVALNPANARNMRTLTNYIRKRHGIKFCVLSHKDQQILEVARIE